ncbi:LOW QUALITY PROTEIN: hypothetical protein PHMEG_00035651 [Phytophthora megakarya]|uniref:Eukaryotic/viral aspartic protease n=1 Tax=Phytophthora megakarya TaxID=4795 RepID=A0A225UMW2_9STRA|nr:LOW QUALITY PROTEIN: hypothetical protein PHMEG_00035651 [Phytophthora megakarya]
MAGTIGLDDAGVDELVLRMSTDVAERDDGRAARYVATVRPAMAAVKYVYGEGARRGDSGAQRRELCDDELEAGEGAVSTAAPILMVDEHDISDNEQHVITESSEKGMQCVQDKPNIAQVRLARKRARKAAKRQKMRRPAAERRHIEFEHVGEQQQLVEAQRELRQQAGVEALRELDERQQQKRDELEGGGAKWETWSSMLRTSAACKHMCNTAKSAGGGVKLDSCARYTVVGTERMQFGDRLSERPPVGYVEGIGEILLEVVGVWSYTLTSGYGERIKVKACVVSGCTDEFLLGVDFMQEHGCNLDFDRNEVRYQGAGRVIVVPFRTYTAKAGTRVAVIRMASRTQLDDRTVTPVQVAVTADDGEQGIFVPATYTGAVMLAPTLTTVKDGKAWVPAVKAGAGSVRLPTKKELGTWVPVGQEMLVLAMNGELQNERLNEWLVELGDTVTPLENEEEVQIGIEEPAGRNLMLKLLRAYRNLAKPCRDCPPATSLDVRHHIDTGNASPILLKRRRQSLVEEEVVDDNVKKMLSAGVIEESNGAWGFPVVLVRKKDGEGAKQGD